MTASTDKLLALCFWAKAARAAAPGLILCMAIGAGQIDRPAFAAAEDDAPILDPTAARVSQWIERDPVIGSIWRGDAEVGFLQTQGNKDTRSLLVKLRLHNEREQWRHAGRGDFIFREDDEGNNSEQYSVLQKSAYKISIDDYLFEQLKYERNRSQGYHYRLSEVVGYGRRVIGRRTVTLDLETGPGLRQTLANSGRRIEERILVFTGELNWDITGSSNFNEYLTVEAGEENIVTDSLTTLTLQVEDHFSARFAFEVVNNSTVPEGVEHTDTITSVTLVYTF